ncbi:MAG: hypothetical protein HWD61_09530 [Parachlamydiaceae bacterium]|nr:MAG: hypothetical protein HWD61_09530 [Parachlamydiaceae bacterium]
MGIINNLDTIDAIHNLLFPNDGDPQVEIHVNFRGRKFSAHGEEFCLNDLVKQVQTVAKTSLSDAPQGPTDKMEQIILKIKELDREGEKILDQKNVLIKAITFFPAFWELIFRPL